VTVADGNENDDDSDDCNCKYADVYAFYDT
jgi:hypothetical protein